MILLIIGFVILILGLIIRYLDNYFSANKDIHIGFIIIGLTLIILNSVIILLTPFMPCVKLTCGYSCYGDCGEDYYKNCVEVVPCPKGVE